MVQRPRLPFHSRPDDPAPGDEIHLLDWQGSDIGGHVRQVKRVLSEGTGTDVGIYEVVDEFNQRRLVVRCDDEDGWVWEEIEP